MTAVIDFESRWTVRSTPAPRAASPTRPRPPRSGALDARGPGMTRLTRRGRVVLTLMLGAVLLVALNLVADRSTASGATGPAVPTRVVSVEEGDTLWEIAGDAAPDGGIREMVHRIIELNALPGPELAVGQELAVPVP